jgi:hypothetical protein
MASITGRGTNVVQALSKYIGGLPFRLLARAGKSLLIDSRSNPLSTISTCLVVSFPETGIYFKIRANIISVAHTINEIIAALPVEVLIGFRDQ